MKIKNPLSNTQMGKVVANFFRKDLKKEVTTDKDGKVVLSADEEQRLTQHFGARFVEVLKGTAFLSENEAASDLYDAAVEHARNEAQEQYMAQIEQLQSEVAVLAAKPEDLPVVQKAGKTAGSLIRRIGNFRADMTLSHNLAAMDFLQSGNMAASPTIEVADIQNELGPYMSQGNNLDVLHELYQGFTTSKYLTWKRAVTEYVAVLSESVDHVVQQFKAAWSPKGGAKFRPLTIRNYRHKVDYSIDPSDVGESWLFHLYDESLTPDQMPITRYIIDQVLLPKIAEDMELVMTGKAKRVEGSDKTEETMNGIETQLVEAKKNLDKGINFFKTDKNLLAATDAEVVEVIDDFVASIAPLYKSMKMPIFLSADVYLKYKRGYKAKWGAGSGTEKADFGQDRVDFSNCFLQVLDCLHGSPIVFSTPSQNFIGLQHKNPPQFITDIQKHDREVHILMEFWYGIGFLIGEAVFAIVPDDYDPSTVTASTREGAPGKWIVTEADKAAFAHDNSETL